jgi:hypothetical protein
MPGNGLCEGLPPGAIGFNRSTIGDLRATTEILYGRHDFILKSFNLGHSPLLFNFSTQTRLQDKAISQEETLMESWHPDLFDWANSSYIPWNRIRVQNGQF